MGAELSRPSDADAASGAVADQVADAITREYATLRGSMGPAAAAEIAAAAQRRLGELSWQDLAPADAQKRAADGGEDAAGRERVQRQRVSMSSDAAEGAAGAAAAPTGNELGVAAPGGAERSGADEASGASQPRSTGVAAMHSAAALASLATAVPGTTQPMIMTAVGASGPGLAAPAAAAAAGEAAPAAARHDQPCAHRPAGRRCGRARAPHPVALIDGGSPGDAAVINELLGLPSVHALRERRAQLEAAGAAGGPHIAAAATAAPAGSDAPAHTGDATSTGASTLVEMAGGAVGGDGGGAAAAAEGPAWLPEEDALIVDAVRRVGFQWRAIAALLGVRSDGETRRRFSAIHQAGAKLCAPAGGPAADGSPMAPPVDPTTGGVAGADGDDGGGSPRPAAAPLAPGVPVVVGSAGYNSGSEASVAPAPAPAPKAGRAAAPGSAPAPAMLYAPPRPCPPSPDAPHFPPLSPPAPPRHRPPPVTPAPSPPSPQVPLRQVRPAEAPPHLFLHRRAVLAPATRPRHPGPAAAAARPIPHGTCPRRPAGARRRPARVRAPGVHGGGSVPAGGDRADGGARRDGGAHADHGAARQLDSVRAARPRPPRFPPLLLPARPHALAPPRRSQEDDLIRASVLQLGPKWGLIANRLKGRTEHAVRNRWHRLQSQLRQIAAEQAAVHAAAGAHTAAGAHATVAHSQAPPIFPPGTTVYRVSNGAPQLMLPPPGMPGGPPPGAVAGTRPPPAGAAAAAPGTVYISGASCAAPLYTGGLPTPTAHAYAPPPGHAGPPPPRAPPSNSGAMYMQPVYQYQMPAHVAAPQHLQPPPHFQHLPPHEFPPHQQAAAAGLGGAVAAATLRGAAAPRQRPTRRGAARQRAVGDERGVCGGRRRARRRRRQHGVQRRRRAVGRAVGGGRRRGADRLRPFSGVRGAAAARRRRRHRRRRRRHRRTVGRRAAADGAVGSHASADRRRRATLLSEYSRRRQDPPFLLRATEVVRWDRRARAAVPRAFSPRRLTIRLVFPPECIFDLPSLFLQSPQTEGLRPAQ